MLQNLLTITWDPDRNLFVIPFFNHPVTWYGVLFALGFFVGYFLIRRIFATHLSGPQTVPAELKLEAIGLADRLAVLVILGTVIGARLGHVFFYGWPYYKAHPDAILRVWEGGLASHGGAIGVLVGLIIFTLWHRKKYPSLTFLATLDALVIPTAFAGGCIRIGNFINQEIVGKPTDLPWGVRFGHPLTGPANVPLHPAQLYESLFYFATFSFLLYLWNQHGRRLGGGLLAGTFFILVFGFRFLIEFLKFPQSALLTDDAPLNMGQLLSIPFVLLGILLLFFYWVRKKG